MDEQLYANETPSRDDHGNKRQRFDDDHNDDDVKRYETIWSVLKRQTKTKLQGAHSVLVDIGSRLNIVGANTERSMPSTAAQHEHHTKYQKIKL